MIQIYSAENDDFRMNGDAILHPTKCEAKFILNGVWSLEMEHPIDDNMELLSVGSVLCVDTPYGEKQLYRIYAADKSDFNISVDALPIFLDSKNECFIYDIRPTNKNGQQALNMMLSGNSKYGAQSDIKKISTAYYIMKNFIEALNGNDDNSFLNRWGGEIAYKNYTVIVNEKIGNDNGLRVEFGFNLLGINESIDMTDVVTSIIPQAYNGHRLPSSETVDSQIVSNYPIIYKRVIKYDDIKLKEDATDEDAENGTMICSNANELYAALRNRAKHDFESGIDMPNITYDIDMIDLSRTDLYSEYKHLLTVNLGDTVHVKHRRLNIVTTARVIELVYDCITEKVVSLVLGDYKKNYFNDVSSVVNSAKEVIDTSNGSLMADKIKGIINLMNTSLRAQKDIAERQDVRAILFEDLDSSSSTFGAMCIGTQGIQISKKRNESNSDWVWGTAIDFKSIYAEHIITGILSDQKGNNHWNLDTGELVTKNMKATNAEIKGRITSGEISGVNINGAQIKLTRDRYVDVRSGDTDKIMNYVMGRGSLSADEKKRLDFNNDGVISSVDYIIAQNILNGSINNHFIDEIFINYEKSEIICKTRHSNGQLSNEWETQIKAGGVVTGSIIAGKRYSDGDVSAGFNGKYFISRGCGFLAGGYGSEGMTNLQMYTGSGTFKENSYLFNAGSGYLSLGASDEIIDSFGGRLYLDPKDQTTYDMFVRPKTNGKTTLGSSQNRFYRLYSRYSEDATSDRRQKKDFKEFDDRYIKLVEQLMPTFYRFKEQTEEQSLQAGFIAQDVIEAMKKCGINKKEFGVVKHSTWKDKKTGEEKDEYSLVYSFFIPLLTFYINYKNKEFESRIAKLEKTYGGD